MGGSGLGVFCPLDRGNVQGLRRVLSRDFKIGTKPFPFAGEGS
jgi:hypothetical protein